MGKRCKNDNILTNVWHLLVEVIDILDVVVEVVVVVVKVTKVILNDDGQSHRCQGGRGPGGDILILVTLSAEPFIRNLYKR